MSSSALQIQIKANHFETGCGLVLSLTALTYTIIRIATMHAVIEIGTLPLWGSCFYLSLKGSFMTYLSATDDQDRLQAHFQDLNW